MGIRCFIAIELLPELRRSVWNMTAPLRDTGADVKWVSVDNFHLTLKFLGDTPEEKLPAILDALQSVATGCDSFDMVFKGAGAFPDERRPRVVWVGIERSEGLSALYASVERAMAAIGFEPEGRAFSPHMTIGRVRSPKGTGGLLRELSGLKGIEFGTVRVCSLDIMKSELGASGARHTRLHEIPLGPQGLFRGA